MRYWSEKVECLLFVDIEDRDVTNEFQEVCRHAFDDYIHEKDVWDELLEYCQLTSLIYCTVNHVVDEGERPECYSIFSREFDKAGMM